MAVFVSMLRGINVTGHRTVPMSELRTLYESLGFMSVATYIQSGNVVFRSAGEKPDVVASKIRVAIQKRFGFAVTVIIRQPAEIRKIVRGLPFTGRRGIDERRLHVTFLNATPGPALVKGLAPLAAESSDEYKVVGREVYLHCPNGYGKTLLSNAFFEKHLKVEATTRNWRTVNALLEVSIGLE
jgi:uncharacterized protein (DUF1697 family)